MCPMNICVASNMCVIWTNVSYEHMCDIKHVFHTNICVVWTYVQRQTCVSYQHTCSICVTSNMCVIPTHVSYEHMCSVKHVCHINTCVLWTYVWHQTCVSYQHMCPMIICVTSNVCVISTYVSYEHMCDVKHVCHINTCVVWTYVQRQTCVSYQHMCRMNICVTSNMCVISTNVSYHISIRLVIITDHELILLICWGSRVQIMWFDKCVESCHTYEECLEGCTYKLRVIRTNFGDLEIGNGLAMHCAFELYVCDRARYMCDMTHTQLWRDPRRRRSSAILRSAMISQCSATEFCIYDRT